MTKICLMCGDTFPDTISFCAKDGSALRAAVIGDHLIGEVFCDRYVVTDLLGEGGMGAVYAARDVRLPQQVAIKVLREQGMADPSTVARFRQEAAAASRINHDRVARVTDFGFMTDGRAFLVMEFVGGRTLKQVIADRGAMDAADVSRIVTMVAEGLDAAHRLGIIHRDLKPDNVMVLDDAGGGVRVKVLDFGIAKDLQASGESAGRTQTGFVVGTPQWMSPEQILGETPDGRSDVYALALLAYAMLTGHRAFEGASAEAEMMARLTSLPRPLSELLPSVSWPVGLQELLNRTLAREVNERPSGALAFAKEFASVTANGGTSTATVPGIQALDALVATFADTAGPPRTRTPVTPFTASRAVAPGGLEASGSTNAVSSSASSSGTTATRSKVVPVALGVAAIAAIAFFAVRQFTSSANGPTDPAAGASNSSTTAAPTTAAATRDSVNRGGGTTPGVETPPAAVLPGTTPQTTIPKPPGGQSVATQKAGVPSSATGVGSAAGATAPVGAAAGGGGDAAKPLAPRGTQDGTNAAPATSAHDELLRLMDVADVDLSCNDTDALRIRAREIIRKLELLAPRLTAATDQGNAHLYVGMSYATLGDTAKACTSINRADLLAAQSKALRSNVELLHRGLRCFP